MKELKLTHATLSGNIDNKTKMLLTGKDKFAKDYCDKKGWEYSLKKLTIEQLLEIRRQEGWKNPKS